MHVDMIDEALLRLRNRSDDLKLRVIPEFENKTQLIYSQIMQLLKESEERKKLEAEYIVLSKDLSIRCDELIGIRQEIENLEMEKKFASR